MGAYCTSVEKAVAAKIPDIQISEKPADVPMVSRNTSKGKSKSRANSESPKFRLSISKLGSLKNKLSLKKSKAEKSSTKSTKSVKIDEERTDKPSDTLTI